jgi:hypothetical protein
MDAGQAGTGLMEYKKAGAFAPAFQLYSEVLNGFHDHLFPAGQILGVVAGGADILQNKLAHRTATNIAMADKKYLDHRKNPPFRCGYCSTETGKMQLADGWSICLPVL